MKKKLRKLHVNKRVYFPYWRRLVNDVCSNCSICNSTDGERQKQGLSQIFEADRPMQQVPIDLTGEHPTSSQGAKYIFNSRYLIAVPIRSKFAHYLSNTAQTSVH
jgi:hypothetical protein